MKILFILLGTFLTVLGLWRCLSVIGCREKLQGEFVSILPTPTTILKNYSPVFRYTYGGQEYTRPALQNYPAKVIPKKFRAGQSYPLYLNPKLPDRPAAGRLPQAMDWMLLVMGVLLTAAAFGV